MKNELDVFLSTYFYYYSDGLYLNKYRVKDKTFAIIHTYETYIVEIREAYLNLFNNEWYFVSENELFFKFEHIIYFSDNDIEIIKKFNTLKDLE